MINRCIVLADCFFILAAGGVAWLGTPQGDPLFTWLQALTVALVMTISFIWTMRWMGNYRVERFRKFWRPLFDLICGFAPAASAGAVIVIAFVPGAWERSDWLITWMAMIFAVLVLGRQVYRILLVIVDRFALLRSRVVVVGSGELCDQIVAQLRAPAHDREYHLIGVFDLRLNRSWRVDGGETPNPRRIPDLIKYAQNYAVDLVVVAHPWDRVVEIGDLVRALQWISADVVIPFDGLGMRPQFVPSMSFVSTPLLQVMHRPLKGSQALLKLAEDWILGAIAVMITAPIMLAAAVAIRLESGKPILFRQPRVGFNGKPFVIYKFRTMSVDPTDDGSAGTKRDNQRITRVGRFLRRTSIDELPQLFNVLRGEMSIVGPRPHVANMVVGEGIYSDVVQQYAARHRIKPGITGWAQINGMRGGIDTIDKANRGAELDLYYIVNWSWVLDLEIMVKTVFIGLVGRNVF